MYSRKNIRLRNVSALIVVDRFNPGKTIRYGIRDDEIVIVRANGQVFVCGFNQAYKEPGYALEIISPLLYPVYKP